jgi:hypothetical protein
METKSVTKICCQYCNKEINESELVSAKCSGCGEDLTNPSQHVSIEIVGLFSGGQTL